MALGKMGSKEAVKPLINLLNSKNEGMSNIMAKSRHLRRFFLNKVSVLTQSFFDILNRMIFRNLPIKQGETKSDRNRIPEIIDLLPSEVGTRSNVAIALGEIDSIEAVKPLINLLSENEPESVRIGAAVVLGAMGSSKKIKRSLTPLFNLLSDSKDHGELHYKAGMTLGEMGSSDEVKDLLDLLSENESVRFGAARVLETLEASEEIKILMSLLSDNYVSESVHIGAAMMLGVLGSLGDEIPLINLLSDNDNDTEVITRMVKSRPFVLFRSFFDVLNRVIFKNLPIKQGKTESGRNQTPHIDLSPSEVNIRGNVAMALGEIGSPEAVKPLINLLNDKNEEERARGYAAEALGKIGSSEAIKPLINLLNDKNEDQSIRYKAVVALGEMDTSEIVTFLINLLNDKSEAQILRARVASDLKMKSRPPKRVIFADGIQDCS